MTTTNAWEFFFFFFLSFFRLKHTHTEKNDFGLDLRAEDWQKESIESSVLLHSSD